MTTLETLSGVLADLRHLYAQMVNPQANGHPSEAAQGLLGPAIARLEYLARALAASPGSSPPDDLHILDALSRLTPEQRLRVNDLVTGFLAPAPAPEEPTPADSMLVRLLKAQVADWKQAALIREQSVGRAAMDRIHVAYGRGLARAAELVEECLRSAQASRERKG